ncbi:putative expansin-B2 [Neltuma alba]|uniref:putative expansin-B2 n=1 Tax=Neltuma alba TaxID=207710 RepID=UPI0010A34164|nr:putative expansin-B2 [Prosopis alba]
MSNLATSKASPTLALMIPSSLLNPRMFLNSSHPTADSEWSLADATWYGSPNGAGSDGGACGYGSDVEKAPFSSMIAAGGPPIYNSGNGCGSCYQVKCTSNPACSGSPVGIVISDECPGCGSTHFDLSGTAFGALAISGQDDQLRNVGKLQIQYKRIQCNYGGKSIKFEVDAGSNQYYFAVLVEYVNGDGDLSLAELKQANFAQWQAMQLSSGATWKLNSATALQAPFSIRLTTFKSKKTLEAVNVIQEGWSPGQIFQSSVNF